MPVQTLPRSTAIESLVAEVRERNPHEPEFLQAVQEVLLTIGPAIENGFYYDFFRNEPFTTEDFAAIERMWSRTKSALIGPVSNFSVREANACARGGSGASTPRTSWTVSGNLAA